MGLASTKLKINCSANKLWEMMVEKIRRPDKYVPGVTEVKVLQDFGPLSIEREMIVKNGTEEHTVRELITADETSKTVIFKLKDHPHFTGYVINMIFDDGDDVELDYTAHWTKKDPHSDVLLPNLEEMIRKAVEHTKELAEVSS